MRCDNVNSKAFRKPLEGFSIVQYNDNMKSVWISIQKEAGQFENYSDEDIVDYFEKTFLIDNGNIEERCFFLKDEAKDKYVGTCCAWFSNKGDKIVPVLHWLAVIPLYRNHGYARMLITQVMQYFTLNNEKEAVYLHTQPESFKAIKLYNDFGFNISKNDTYGNAVNEYEDSIVILKNIMDNESYLRLMETAV